VVDFDELVNKPAIAAFGQAVTILPKYGARYEIDAIFRRSSDDDLVDPGAISSEAYLSARTADVSNVTRDDRIEVGGITFRAAHPVPGDKGMTRIPLRSIE
jgi:hypothetical protein